MIATAAEAVRSRDYLTLMQCRSTEPWLAKAVELVQNWLGEKQIAADLSTSGDHVHARGTLTVRRVKQDATNYLRLSMVEDDPKTGTWTTELLARDDSGSTGWINLEVTNSRGQFVNVPRVARALMRDLPLADASLEFSPQHRLFGVDDVNRLIQVLADGRRHGLVFVAGSPSLAGAPLDAYTTQVDRWTREVYGLAQVIVLDADASLEFRDRVGEGFAAPSVTIRSYQPGVRFGDPRDAKRHRILGTSRLASQSDRSIQYLLGDIARAQSASRPLDPGVQRVRRAFDRLENSRLVDRITTAVGPAVSADTEPVETAAQSGDLLEEAARESDAAEATLPDAVALDAVALGAVTENALVRRVLGLAQITEQSLRDFVNRLTSRRESQRSSALALQERLATLQAAKERLEDQNGELTEALDDAQLEAEVSRLDVDDREDRVRWLEARLKDQGDYDASWTATPEEFKQTRPGSFSELIDRIDQLTGVEFTGDASEVEKLNQIDTNDSALRTAWDAVQVMVDYARARHEGVCDQGLDHYIRHTPTGFCTIPSRKFAESESAATMQAYGSERIFPVPTLVDPGGEATMKAHFKLARIGQASPRMHVFDGHPNAACVYIGYIGTHLRTAQGI